MARPVFMVFNKVLLYRLLKTGVIALCIIIGGMIIGGKNVVINVSSQINMYWHIIIIYYKITNNIMLTNILSTFTSSSITRATKGPYWPEAHCFKTFV